MEVLVSQWFPIGCRLASLFSPNRSGTFVAHVLWVLWLVAYYMGNRASQEEGKFSEIIGGRN